MVGVEGGNLISSMIRAKVVSKQTSKIKRYKGHFRNSVNESAIPGNEMFTDFFFKFMS